MPETTKGTLLVFRTTKIMEFRQLPELWDICKKNPGQVGLKWTRKIKKGTLISKANLKDNKNYITGHPVYLCLKQRYAMGQFLRTTAKIHCNFRELWKYRQLTNLKYFVTIFISNKYWQRFSWNHHIWPKVFRKWTNIK